MTILTEEQEKLFYIWIQKYIKDYGHDFAGGWYVVPVGTDEILFLDNPKHDEWVEEKKKEFLNKEK